MPQNKTIRQIRRQKSLKDFYETEFHIKGMKQFSELTEKEKEDLKNLTSYKIYVAGSTKAYVDKMLQGTTKTK